MTYGSESECATHYTTAPRLCVAYVLGQVASLGSKDSLLLLLLLLLLLFGLRYFIPGAFRNYEWKKALKKEKCLSWVVSVSRYSMAQCRNEVRTDLVNLTERLKDDGKEMMIAWNFNIFTSLRLAAASAAEAAQADDILR